MHDIHTKKGLCEFLGGQWFTVRFVKSNGQIRTMTARIGVTKHVQGDSDRNMSLHATHASLIVVWEAKTKAYKSFHAHKVLTIKCYGMTVDIESIRNHIDRQQEIYKTRAIAFDDGYMIYVNNEFETTGETAERLKQAILSKDANLHERLFQSARNNQLVW